MVNFKYFPAIYIVELIQMAIPIKVSEKAYKVIVRKKGELTMRRGRNVSIIEAVDVILGVDVGAGRKRK